MTSSLLRLLVVGCLVLSETRVSAQTQTPVNVDAKVTVDLTGYVLNRATNTFDAMATVTNRSRDTLLSPMLLVVTDVTPPVALANAIERTPDGAALVTIPLPSGGLAPGTTVSDIVLKFQNDRRVRFTFTTSVLAAVHTNTSDVCTGGTPSGPPSPPGTPCSDSRVCNRFGACVDASLVLHYDFDEAVKDGTIRDRGANGLDGSLVDADPDASIGEGHRGLALVLDGVKGFVSVPVDPRTRVNHYTLAAWVTYNEDNPQDRYEVLEKDASYWMNIRATRRLRAGGFYGGCVPDATIPGHDVFKNVDSATVIVPGEWTHVASTYDGVMLRIYVNGVLDAMRLIKDTPNAPGGETCANDLPLAVGAKNAVVEGGVAPEAFLGGSLDDVRIYNRALSEHEIQDLVRPRSSTECLTGTDCPGHDTECQIRTCNFGVCGVFGTSTGPVLLDRVAGDCHRSRCDALGHVVDVIDNTDLPEDNNPCTRDLCVNGVPSTPPFRAGRACAADGGTVCDGAGRCVECLNASQCPGQDDECGVRTCIAGACGMSFAAAGNPVAHQTPGDCHVVVCDGAGATRNDVDDLDVPDGGNACTRAACSSGLPSSVPVADGDPCAAGTCDGSGTCVAGCPSASDCPA